MKSLQFIIGQDNFQTYPKVKIICRVRSSARAQTLMTSLFQNGYFLFITMVLVSIKSPIIFEHFRQYMQNTQQKHEVMSFEHSEQAKTYMY